MNKSEYSEEFDKLRKNRVEVSFYKYGSARDITLETGALTRLPRRKCVLKPLKKTTTRST